MSESAYNSPLFSRRLTESCCSSPARSIGTHTSDTLTDSDGEGDQLFTEIPTTPDQTVIAGWLKFRDNKKWKQRWGVITKLSPAAGEFAFNYVPMAVVRLVANQRDVVYYANV
ncbi:hypothetical protein TcasGA2_TC034079 [Tribolium castaneum]|uniref:PH domain-containing protein n=1 Tax=Tribolium castaneum TaxID=7070 RepID=A0A139WDD5_TRICA|nr:hypothetical protein TcasGA2_TC034079 [Tribolium castaneum]